MAHPQPIASRNGDKAPSTHMTRMPFPQTVEDFENDPRIAYDKTEEMWILEDDDGSQWEYSESLKRWIPTLDEEQVERQREAYIPDDQAVPSTTSQQGPKKRKNNQAVGEQQDTADSKRQKSAGNGKSKPERQNTAIYITSIPLDATVEEVTSVFARYGVIKEAVETGEPRVKLYTDSDGKFKGDALVIYFRPESVQLAIQMLDDSDFRLGEEGPAGKMRVIEADSSYKKQKEAPASTNARDKAKIIAKTQKMNNKLADWDDDDPSVLPEKSSRADKVVVLHHMFTLKELEEDPAALLDIKEDVREECEKLGQVTNVVLFDKEPTGIMTVRFSAPEAARACVRLMNGRVFDGRTVVAEIAKGNERFQKSKEGHGQEDDEQEAKRLDRFSEWIEKEEA